MGFVVCEMLQEKLGMCGLGREAGMSTLSSRQEQVRSVWAPLLQERTTLEHGRPLRRNPRARKWVIHSSPSRSVFTSVLAIT